MTAFSTRTLPLCGSGVLVPTGSVLGRRPPKPSTGRSVGAVRPHRIVRHFLMLRAGAPFRDGRFPVGLPTGRFASRDTLCQLHAGRTRAADSTTRQPIAVTFRLMPPGIF